MEALQTIADEAEDARIRRYLQRRDSTLEVTVCCGRCGAPQTVRPDRGMLRFSLVCFSCHRSTLISLPRDANPGAPS